MATSATALSEPNQSPATQDNGKGSNVYKIITQQILNLLEQGTIPWKRPWSITQSDDPVNIRGTPYRGANYFLLSCLGYDRPIFLTYKQSLELGGNVKQGEKGIPVVYWRLIDVKEIDKVTGEVEIKRVPFLRYYTVFNIEQCENIKLPAQFSNTNQPPPDFDPIEAAEAIWTGYPNPPVLHHRGNRAYYRLGTDEIVMPPLHSFEKREEYYSTLFHEMGHSTRHNTRLHREFGRSKVQHGYAREELVAEMTSAFLCGRAGISQPVLENQAAYLASWSKNLKDDPKLFVVAAGHAQKAADHILNAKATEEATEMCA